ncbi:MAG: hypothetical protein ACOX2R_01710 [Anaerolineae bacterium]|jgi:hypothetical protein
MGFLSKLFGSGRSRESGDDPHGLHLYFRCQKCGEVIDVRVDKRNDLNREDEGPGPFLLRKEVMGSKRCFALIRAEVWFDANYAVAQADIQGGSLVSKEEYGAYIEAEA